MDGTTAITTTGGGSGWSQVPAGTWEDLRARIRLDEWCQQHPGAERPYRVNADLWQATEMAADGTPALVITRRSLDALLDRLDHSGTDTG